jgi:hypothetical protein
MHCVLTMPGITEDKDPFYCSKNPPQRILILTVSFPLFGSRAIPAIASFSKPASSSFIFRRPSDQGLQPAASPFRSQFAFALGPHNLLHLLSSYNLLSKLEIGTSKLAEHLRHLRHLSLTLQSPSRSPV